MRMRFRPLIFSLLCLLASSPAAGEPAPLTYRNSHIVFAEARFPIRIPQGMVFEYLVQLDGPRLMTFLPNADLLIGSQSGNIYRLVPPYTEAQSLVLLSDYPHSVAFRDDVLYIARTGGLYRAAYKPGQEKIDPHNVHKVIDIPGGRGHSSRTVRVGPDKRLYLSLGITGNCSDEYLHDSYPRRDRRGGVMVLDETVDPPRWRTFASGLRNPVGFDWHPDTGVMYASNNGPDHHGFEQPPESFARLTEGSFHGMPWFQYDGERIRRDDCIARKPPRPIEDVPLPVATFPARNAPMGVAFLDARLTPAWRNDAVVALRGSWAVRPGPSRYGPQSTRRHPGVMLVRFEGGKARRVEPLISGFQLADGERWARPVGVLQGPDGALYVTSDSGHDGLYRLRRESADE